MAKKPNQTEFIQFPVSVPNISSWSVERVRRTLTEHEHGIFTNSAHLFEALERSPKTNAALNRRILTAQGLPFHLETGTGDGRRNDPAVKRIAPYWDQIASRRAGSKFLRWGIGLGIGFGQIVWRVANGDWVPRLQPWHASFFYWNVVEHCYMAQTEQGLVEVRPGDGNWAVFSYDEWNDQPWMRGVVRCLGIPDTIRNLAVRDWARYSEIHGIPIRFVEVPRDEGETSEKQEFISQVENPGNETTVVAYRGKDDQSSYRVSLIEAQDQAWQGFERLIMRCDSDAALAVSGIEMVNETGVYNPKDNSEGVRQDYTEADAVAYSTFLHEQVTTPWARYNLGENAVDSAPRPCYDATRPVDKTAAATTVKMLGDGLTSLNAELRKVNKQVAVEEYVERFDIPLEENTAPPEPVAQPGQQIKPEQPLAKRKPAALSATLGAGLLAGQTYVDDVEDGAIKQAPGATEQMLGTVLGAIDGSTGYEDLRTRLIAALPGIDTAKLRQLLAASMSMAQAAGAWSVESD